MNIEVFWKKERHTFIAEKFNQIHFNKNYNKISAIFNENSVKKIISIECKDLDLTFEVMCKDGLIIKIPYTIEVC